MKEGEVKNGGPGTRKKGRPPGSRNRPRAPDPHDGRRLLEELANIAFADPAEYLKVEEGQLVLRDTADMPPGTRAAIAGIREGTRGLELKLYDKMRALELLGKATGVFERAAGLPEGPFEVKIRVLDPKRGKEREAADKGADLQESKAEEGSGKSAARDEGGSGEFR